MNWFLWSAITFATLGIVVFIALWIDASRGTHPNDRRGAVGGATLFVLCVGIATALGIIGFLVKYW